MCVPLATAAAWICYGLAFRLFVIGLLGRAPGSLALYTAIFAGSYLAGFVALFAPGGIGVREAVIAALLNSRLGPADAIVLAATSRVVLSAIDIVAGVASFGMPALRRKEQGPVGAGR